MYDTEPDRTLDQGADIMNVRDAPDHRPHRDPRRERREHRKIWGLAEIIGQEVYKGSRDSQGFVGREV